jgi:hypothetical protein
MGFPGGSFPSLPNLPGVPDLGISLKLGRLAGKAGGFIDYLASLDIDFEAVIPIDIVRDHFELHIRATVVYIL